MGLKVAIVGAGIGGATAANALLRMGVEVTVYERSPAFGDVGGGLSLGYNASRLLARLGLEPALSRVGVKSRRMVYLDWRGDVLADNLWPAEYMTYMFHRAELLAVLTDALPPDVIQFDHECVAVVEDDAGVRLEFANGRAATPDIVIGADGLNSAVRKAVVDAPAPTANHMMAYRTLVPMERLDWNTDEGTIWYWLGSNQHMLFYPVSSGRLMNVVAYVPTDNLQASESWTAPGDPQALLAMFEGWDAPVVQTIRSMDSVLRQGLYDREPFPKWRTDRIVLLGDAAHPMLPHGGQGAGQSIEDGLALAQLLADASVETAAHRLGAYEALRMDRTSRVQAVSRRNGDLFGDRGEYDQEADVKVTDELSWVVGYDAELAASRVLAD